MLSSKFDLFWQSTSGDRDSDTSSVNSEDRNTNLEDANSDNHKFFINRIMVHH